MTQDQTTSWHCTGFIRGVIDQAEEGLFCKAIGTHFGIIESWIGDDLRYGNPTRYVRNTTTPDQPEMFRFLNTDLGLATVWMAQQISPKITPRPWRIHVTDQAHGIIGTFELDMTGEPIGLTAPQRALITPWINDGPSRVHVVQSHHHLAEMMEDPETSWSATQCARRRARYARDRSEA